ncbi:MAG: hypothetical protein V7K64_17110 [Nostoc sp.]|uniref:hypothetical protein n=1 Tax=unclassified Nostoc TaxID=2593658 RepID=UPI001D2B9CA1|nr:hypothetical protein [Nostoc sp. JL34]MBN3883493.1 hypothetical protein [Nostoc sp. JL34]
MKGFRKLSSIAMLLCAFVYPPSLAEAKDISLSNVRNEQSAAPEANLIGDKTGELLIAQRRPGRYQIIRRRQQFRERQFLRRRQPERYQNIRERRVIRRRQQIRERQFIRRQQPYGRNQYIRGRY